MTAGRSRWTWWLVLLSRRIWFRAAAFALAGALGALAAAALAPAIPSGLLGEIGADDVEDILEILASGMLVVATFSLATMIAAYSVASSSATPRVAELLIEDGTAQNALSIFVGGFLFALVGIIGLNAGIYGENGHVVLFVLTLAAVTVIVITFLRWVETLSHFGRVTDAIRRTGLAAERAVRERVREPWLGARAPEHAPRTPGEVSTGTMGYVRNVDVGALQEEAERLEAHVHVLSPPGTFLDGTRPLVRVTSAVDEDAAARIRLAFDVGETRTFDQDPGYGVSALAEIAVKALSPAISDPRTAVAVLDRLVQVLAPLARPAVPEGPRCDRVFMPSLDLRELFADAFAGIGIYGATDVQVGVRLQQVLRTLARLGDEEIRAAAREQSAVALERARAALALPQDVRRLEALAAEVQGAARAARERSALGG